MADESCRLCALWTLGEHSHIWGGCATLRFDTESEVLSVTDKKIGREVCTRPDFCCSEFVPKTLGVTLESRLKALELRVFAEPQRQKPTAHDNQ